MGVTKGNSRTDIMEILANAFTLLNVEQGKGIEINYDQETNKITISLSDDVEIKGGGTDDYNVLKNKPSIDHVSLQGDINSDELGLMKKSNFDLDGDGIIDIAKTVKGAAESEPGMIFMNNPLTNKVEFVHPPILTNAEHLNPPLNYTELLEDVVYMIELSGASNSLFIQVFEKDNNEEVSHRIMILDPINTSTSLYTDNISCSEDGLKIKDSFVYKPIKNEDNIYEFNIEDFSSIKSMNIEVVQNG